MVDLTHDVHGRTRARLLDLVPGRSGGAYRSYGFGGRRRRDAASTGLQVVANKTQLIRRKGSWRDVGQVELETLHWVRWFNGQRTHGPIHDLIPAREDPIRGGRGDIADASYVLEN